jgi:type I restriction enzyme S subunit
MRRLKPIDKAKANIERNLANARELFQSRLNEIFSNPSEDWEVKQLGEVCNFVRGPFGGSLKKSCFVSEGYAGIRTKASDTRRL